MRGARSWCGRCRSRSMPSDSRRIYGNYMKQTLLLASCLSTAILMCDTALAQWQGRSVGDVLDGLRSQGLTFIYSTQIVRPDLRITTEPHAREGVELAREILAAHGLALS